MHPVIPNTAQTSIDNTCQLAQAFAVNRALVYIEWGDIDPAILLLEECLAITTIEEELLNVLITCYIASGRNDEAKHLALHALRIYPNSATIQRYLGKIFYLAGDYHSSLYYCELSRAYDPHDSRTLLLLAEILVSVGRHSEAHSLLIRLLPKHQSPLAVYSLLWRLYQKTQRHDQEFATLQNMAALHPQSIDEKLRMAQLLITKKNRPKRGVQLLRKQHNNRESTTSINRLLAEGYSKLRLHRKAQTYYRKVLRSSEREDSDVINLMVSFFDCAELNACEDLVRKFSKSIYSSTFRYNAGLIAIARGDFTAGWQLLDWRWTSEYINLYQYHTILENIPKWEGESLEGKTLLVLGEQGLGEEILFSSLVNELSATAKGIVLIGNPRLKGLFNDSLKGVQFVGRDSVQDQWQRIRHVDVWCFSGTIARYTRRTINAFQASNPYIKVQPSRTKALRDKYLESSGHRPIVGISFASIGSGFSGRKTPPKFHWIELMKNLPFYYVNIQYGAEDKVVALDNALLSNDIDFFRDDTVDPNGSLDGQAAQLAALDCVISVSNTTAHLAAAIGIRTYVLLPYNVALVWTLPFKRISLWYPTAFLVRQASPGCWREAFLDLRRLCHTFAKKSTAVSSR